MRVSNTDFYFIGFPAVLIKCSKFNNCPFDDQKVCQVAVIYHIDF